MPAKVWLAHQLAKCNQQFGIEFILPEECCFRQRSDLSLGKFSTYCTSSFSSPRGCCPSPLFLRRTRLVVNANPTKTSPNTLLYVVILIDACIYWVDPREKPTPSGRRPL